MRFSPMIVGLLLAGCSLGEIGSPAATDQISTKMPDLVPLAPNVEEVFKKLKLPGTPKVSRLRNTHILAPAPWIFCLKSDLENDRHVYALFVRDNVIVDFRLAVVIDQCENADFAALASASSASSSASSIDQPIH